MDSVIVLNGKERRFFAENVPNTLSSLLTQLDVLETTAVVEIDGRLVHPKDFSETLIRDGQRIELVRFMGGG